MTAAFNLETALAFALLEATGALQQALKSAHQEPHQRTSPPRYIASLCDAAGERALHPDLRCKQGLGHVVRQIHDFYGWKAKGSPENRGVCAGTLYRSVGFMRLNVADRVGARVPKDITRGIKNIHIEHTVPVGSITTWIKKSASAGCEHAALHGWIIGRSVCTAITEHQRLVLADAEKEKTTVRTVERDHLPFTRYQGVFGTGGDHDIYDVTTGNRVDFSRFSYEDHRASLDRLSIRALKSHGHPSAYALDQFDGLPR